MCQPSIKYIAEHFAFSNAACQDEVLYGVLISNLMNGDRYYQKKLVVMMS
ncbi:hypothetical protein [Chroogloeocystis siderophila]|jgi:hypothetical protein|nr:hypothetical protein [Chroogloeocystis siderophila]